MSSRMRRVIVVVLALAAALAVVGCQSVADKAAEVAVEQTTGTEIEREDGSITITGEDGTEVTASEGGDLPDGFPTDVPVHEGAIVSSVKTGGGYLVVIEAPASVESVFDWYKEQLEDTAWKMIHETKVPDGAAIGAENDSATLQITVNADSDAQDKSSITLMYAPKE